MLMNNPHSPTAQAARYCPPRSPLRQRLVEVLIQTTTALAMGSHRCFGARHADEAGILTYHRTAPHVPGLPAPRHNVAPERLRAQLSGLLRRGYQFLPLSRLLAANSAGEALPSRTVIATFDDGYESLYAHAWPVLQELRIPFSLFVCTSFLDDEAPFPFDEWGMQHHVEAPRESWRALRSWQIREMQQSGLMELGAHSDVHEDFRGRPREFAADLAATLRRLREEFHCEAPPYAFPYGCPHRGFASGALLEAARRAGVRCGLTTECRLVTPGSDPFTWGRFNVFAWDTDASLAAKLAGWYDWAPRMRKRLVRAWSQLMFPGTRVNSG